MTPRITDQLVLWPDGSTSLPPIDLVNGPDPDGPPEPKMVDLPQWPGYVCHVEWPHDSSPVMLDPSTVYTPDLPVDLRCGHCVAGNQIYLDHQQRLILFLINHQPGCPFAADIAALCRSAS